jgi:exodeoxyribonuclease V beta subunit
VVTVHRAKGLEYAVVFCPFAYLPPSAQERKGWRAAHDDQGRPTLHFAALDDPALKARRARAAAEEELRLLYVALTRAVHRCVVVCGLFRNQRNSDSVNISRKSLLNWLVAGGGGSPADWAVQPPEAEVIDASWQALQAARPGDIVLAPLPTTTPTGAIAAPPAALPPVQALGPPARLPEPWWWGSYSRLVHGARAEGAEADHDNRAATSPRGRAGPHVPEGDVLRFPAGTDAGHCLHAAFEAAEFTEPDTWPQAAAHALRTRPPRLGDLAPDTAHSMLARALEDVLRTPLTDGLQLCAVGPRQRQAELEFTLPAGNLEAAALGAVLTAHGYAAPQLEPVALRGMLRGFIDLVFEHDGRWYVLDWKSNHLGDRPEDYAAPALRAEMHLHHYTLQALLYTLALHRHLVCRLPGYRYDTHFGGVLYLFVRAVRPGWTQDDGRPAGVHFDRPPQALIEALEPLFGAQGLT